MKINYSTITFDNSFPSPSISFSSDFIVDANTNRLLLNSNDAEFYLGQYSTPNAPVINSSGSSGLNLYLNSRSGATFIGDTDFATNTTRIEVNDTTELINLRAPNVDSYGYSMPICFEVLAIDRQINYTSGGQTWELAWIENANLPPEFFVENPPSYSSTNWRIDFTIQTWNAGGQDNSADKGLAYYIAFEDQSTNIYTPILFNALTPFCRHNNNSTWTGGGSLSEFQSFTWTDYVSFAGLIGTTSSNLPLKVNLYFAADNSKNFTFSMKVGLTRTNVLP
jgi:hypothetical protein